MSDPPELGPISAALLDELTEIVRQRGLAPV